MKVLIRDMSSGYYANNSGWVADINHAQDFENARKAIQYGCSQHLKHVEIYYTDDNNPKSNFTTGPVDFP